MVNDHGVIEKLFEEPLRVNGAHAGNSCQLRGAVIGDADEERIADILNGAGDDAARGFDARAYGSLFRANYGAMLFCFGAVEEGAGPRHAIRNGLGGEFDDVPARNDRGGKREG